MTISPSKVFVESPAKELLVATPDPPESVIVIPKFVEAGVSNEKGFLTLLIVMFPLEPPDIAVLTLNLMVEEVCDKIVAPVKVAVLTE